MSGEIAEDGDDFALDIQVVRGDVDGLHLAVGGLQTYAITLVVEALKGSLALPLQPGYDGITVIDRMSRFNNDDCRLSAIMGHRMG